MKEDEIRGDKYRKELLRLAGIDRANLMKSSKKFVYINCPICNRDFTKIIYKRDGFTFVECQACKMVYVNPRPTKDMLFKHYSTSLSEKYWIENVCPQSNDARAKYIMKPRIWQIIKFCKRNGVPFDTFMDVGAGEGHFCHLIKKYAGFKKVIAVEPSPTSSKKCREKKIEVIKDFIENVKLKKKVNVVSSIESIEHIYNPRNYIESISRNMEIGGILFLTTPNFEGFDISILKDKSDSTTAPDHLNYFNTKNIVSFLEGSGFDVLEVRTRGKLDVELVRKKVIDCGFELKNDFLEQIILGDENLRNSFQKWLAENNMSSSLWVVAKKVSEI